MHSTEGIILKKEPYGEADLLITILTKDFGKIKVMAQGVRKEAAKLKGHLEPLTHSAISFVIGKNFYRITSAEVKDFFIDLRGNLNKLRCAFYIVNLTDSNVFEERGDGRLFDLMHLTLERLDTVDVQNGPGLEKILFEFNEGFLHIFGLLPSPGITPESIKMAVASHFGAKYDIMGI
ncbi:MAG: DNA repair protein RecO [Candidatus Sungbacteria bacterium RIFCSPHIGHO2_02_FULL_41_12b]|nr:MAG: DNA repair protein RecO [Candidatus Sungbacteria bacterium RIFCSPHIGHO2_02_FULL_41_12b]